MHLWSLMNRLRLSLGIVSLAGSASAVLSQTEIYESVELLSDVRQEGDSCGHSVDVYADWAIAGAPQEHFGDIGRVLIYERDEDGNWQVNWSGNNPDAEGNSSFGSSVAITTGWAFVGASHHDEGGEVDQGAVYVYRHAGGAAWELSQVITGPGSANRDFFGTNIDSDDETLIISAHGDDAYGGESGAAYVYNLADGFWTFAQKLTANDGVAGQWFGEAFDIDGSQMVITAWRESGDTGAAYVFERDPLSGLWTQAWKSTLPEGIASGDRFGYEVAIERDHLAIAAPWHNAETGRVFMYRRSDTGWDQTGGILLPLDDLPGQRFGQGVAIEGPRMIIGAESGIVGELKTGKAYLFEWDGANWAGVAALLGTDAVEGDMFARMRALAMDSGWAFVGAPRHDHPLTDNGSVYVYDLRSDCALPMLNVDAECPTGGRIDVTWECATPGGRVAIIFARSLGDYVVPYGYPCQGTLLGLGANQIQVVADLMSDESGTGSRGSSVGAGACDGYLQLMDLASCTTSVVVPIE